MTRMSRLITCVTSVFCLAIALPAAAQYNVFAGGLVIRSSDNTIVRTDCPVGPFPAVSPDGTMISTAQDDVVSVVRTSDCSSTSIPSFVGIGPSVFSPDSRRFYVIDDDGSVTLQEIDAITKKRLRRLSGLPEGTTVAGMATPPDGESIIFMPSATTPTLYAAASDLSWVYDLPLDDTTWPGIGTVLLKWSLTYGSRRLYLAGHQGVGIYDPDTIFLSDTAVPLARVLVSNLTSMGLSPDGSRLYAATRDSTFLVIDTATNAILTSFRLDTTPDAFGLGVTPDGARVYVAGSGKIHVIDTATNTRLTTLAGASSSVVAITRTGFASFTAGAVYSPETDTLSSVTGAFALGADNNGLDLAHDEVTIGFGGRSVWLPAGSFTQSGDGSFHFRGDLSEGQGNGFAANADIEIHSLGGSTYGFSLSVDESGGNSPLSLDAAALPITISLVAGDDGGSTRLDLTGGLTQTIAGLQTDLNASQANVSALQSQNDVLVQANATLTQQVDTLNAQIQPLKDQISSLTAINQSLTSENTRLTAGIASLQERLTAEHARIESLRARVNAADERIEDLRSKLDAERQVVADLRAQIKDLQQRLQAVLAAIDSLNPGQKKAFNDAMAGKKK